MALSAGCAHGGAPLVVVRAHPPVKADAPKPLASSPSADPEPFVPEREKIPAEPPSKYAVGPMTAPPTFSSALYDDTLDAKWTKPWREHLPQPQLTKEHASWATTLATKVSSHVRLDIDRVIGLYALERERANWLSVASGAENSTSAQEAFGELLATCRLAVTELETRAREQRSNVAGAVPPGWSTYRMETAIALGSKATEQTAVPAWYVEKIVLASIDGALEVLRERALDAAFEPVLAEAHARIMAYTKKPKKP